MTVDPFGLDRCSTCGNAYAYDRLDDGTCAVCHGPFDGAEVESDYRVWLRSFDDDDAGKAAEAALDALPPLTDRARGLLFPILERAILKERMRTVAEAEPDESST